ncbi:alpha-glucan family phosphorylase [Polaribacter undariae]|uniref:Alpha-glucan family phosphorylase n=1 Tax=Polaribacter sejongensis TaxID=985043 RepID=A0AAJ1QW97_9FLAO|nr:alpha-glucan family phosphorylase [Polaribacter undariae]MDN3619252.1 alpha-glucan family phosphorylase [Polaribacter undariae]UWD33547.1 alpha-glucan family phosphorylase [Polaribacter undariae]
MEHIYSKWHHPYKPAAKYKKKVAYFSMEFGIDQAFNIYSGGLGFLAGSHMRSGFELKQNMIGIGMLWKYGYYDQARNDDQTLKTEFNEKHFDFLEYTGIEVTIKLHDNPNVKVRAYVLKPEVFGTVPMYFLSTDVDGNDHLSRTITNHLYDQNPVTRISQSIVLGIAGAKVVEALGGADTYHLNEGHALPAFYYLKDNGVTKEQMVFTTHTPEKAGNEERDARHLNRCGFFGRTYSEQELQAEMVNGGMINYTISALRMARKANGVSKLHAIVANDMWKDYEGICEIIPITNAQNQKFWQDETIKKSWEKGNATTYKKKKLDLKSELFEEVYKQTGKKLDPNVLTIVWARRFAGYKRADLLLHDYDRFKKLIHNEKYPVQIIWAGKPYPFDYGAIDTFNHLVHQSKQEPNLAVLIGYEIDLSRKLKCGSDVWLNTPRITREASGTSGMTAAMNGSVNVSTDDGWIPEFKKDEENCFVLPALDYKLPTYEQDKLDTDNLYNILENKVLQTYYDAPKKWRKIVFNAMDDVIPEFTTQRMAADYYKKLF